jgi:NAD(P)-dependent dehydrogenase (short-subunit alcohol dehydrogenase family)
MVSLFKGSAFLTGAGSGIGRATALAFAKYGATRLSLVDHDSSSLAATSKLIKELHPSIQILEHPFDITNEGKVQAAIAKTAAEFGCIDVVVNIAGISHSGLTNDCKTEEWREVLGVNLDGLWFCQREEIRQMLAQEWVSSLIFSCISASCL